EMPLSERIYICKRCGLQKDRDVNAAINMLKSRTCPNLRSGRYLPMRSNRERKQCRGTENIAQGKPTCLRWEDVRRIIYKLPINQRVMIGNLNAIFNVKWEKFCGQNISTVDSGTLC
ncbi:MAG: zinc ribbon domain-containing protein, partial [Conexivisphaerales archaeon]